jgi:hypothetical protein
MAEVTEIRWLKGASSGRRVHPVLLAVGSKAKNDSASIPACRFPIMYADAPYLFHSCMALIDIAL